MTSVSPSPKRAKAPRKGPAPNPLASSVVSDSVSTSVSTAPQAAQSTQSAPDATMPTASGVPTVARVRDRSTTDAASAATGSAPSAARDLAEVSAVELVSTVSVHLLSAAALRCGLADEGEELQDLSEARVIINALAGLIAAASPDLGDTHARALRDGLRSVQLAFREASAIPDAPGEGPGEKYTGPVN